MLNSFKPEKERDDSIEDKLYAELECMNLLLNAGAISDVEHLRTFFRDVLMMGIGFEACTDSRLVAKAEEVWKGMLRKLLTCKDYSTRMLIDDVAKAGSDFLEAIS